MIVQRLDQPGKVAERDRIAEHRSGLLGVLVPIDAQGGVPSACGTAVILGPLWGLVLRQVVHARIQVGKRSRSQRGVYPRRPLALQALCSRRRGRRRTGDRSGDVCAGSAGGRLHILQGQRDGTGIPWIVLDVVHQKGDGDRQRNQATAPRRFIISGGKQFR